MSFMYKDKNINLTIPYKYNSLAKFLWRLGGNVEQGLNRTDSGHIRGSFNKYTEKKL